MKRIPSLKGACVALIGSLGAGKTTFVREWVRRHAPNLAKQVVSPTFILHARYDLPGGAVHHMDWYRLNSESDVLSLGWEDILNESYQTIFVEWADKFPGLLPKNHLEIRFKHVFGPVRRSIVVHRRGGRIR